MSQTINTKWIKEENVCFWLNIEYTPPVSSSLARDASISYDKWVLSFFFFRNHCCMINKFIHIVWWKNTHKIVIYIFISYNFEDWFNRNYWFLWTFFYIPPKRLFKLSFAFFASVTTKFAISEIRALFTFLFLDVPSL